MTDEPDDAQEKLEQAIHEYVQARAEHDGVLLRGVVLCWEQMRFDEDGDALWLTNYTIPQGTTVAQAVGLLAVTKARVEKYLLGGVDD